MRLLCKSGRSQRGLASLLKSLTFMPASNYIDGVYVRPQGKGEGSVAPSPGEPTPHPSQGGNRRRPTLTKRT